MTLREFLSRWGALCLTMTITNVVICAVMMGPFLYLLGILFSPAPVDSGDYNFANKEIRQSGYIDTTVMYALQVAAIALFATWGYLYGLSSILVALFWGAGYIIIIKLLDSGKLDKIILSEHFGTLHQFIGRNVKGQNNDQSKLVSIIASIITLIAISGPAMFEAFFTASVVNLSTGTENFPNIVLASAFIIISALFILRGRFRGSVFLDQLQLATGYLIFVVFLSLFLLIATTRTNSISILMLLFILFLSTLGISISRTWHFNRSIEPDFLAKFSLTVTWLATTTVIVVFILVFFSHQPLSNSSLQLGIFFPSIFSFWSLVSLFVANGLYQLVDVGQWQRFLSASEKEKLSETKILLKNSLWSIAITSPLTWIIATIFGISIHLIIPEGNAYEATYLAINFILKSQSFLSPVLIFLLITSLIAIMFSTIDALITATTFTVSEDITKQLFYVQENKNNLNLDRWATIVATVIQFGIYLFVQWVAKQHADAVLYLCWSFQIAFTPAVIAALFEWKLKGQIIIRSMLFGIIAACFPVFFIGPETVYEYSPFLALLFSTIGAGKDFLSNSSKFL